VLSLTWPRGWCTAGVRRGVGPGRAGVDCDREVPPGRSHVVGSRAPFISGAARRVVRAGEVLPAPPRQADRPLPARRRQQAHGPHAHGSHRGLPARARHRTAPARMGVRPPHQQPSHPGRAPFRLGQPATCPAHPPARTEESTVSTGRRSPSRWTPRNADTSAHGAMEANQEQGGGRTPSSPAAVVTEPIPTSGDSRSAL
jgi:hypothetical protein